MFDNIAILILHRINIHKWVNHSSSPDANSINQPVHWRTSTILSRYSWNTGANAVHQLPVGPARRQRSALPVLDMLTGRAHQVGRSWPRTSRLYTISPIEDQRRRTNAETINQLPWRRADALSIVELEAKRTRRISYALSVREVLAVGADTSSIQIYLSLMRAVANTIFVHRLSSWARAFSILVGKSTLHAHAHF